MNKTLRLTYLSLFLAIAFILSWIELLIPAPVPSIPGIKLGLANVIILFGIFNLKKTEAFMLLIARIMLNALLFGNMMSLLYSVSGGILSFLAMLIVKRISGQEIFTSICGGIFHNIGQLVIASIVLGSATVFSYLPYLTISGIIAGAFNGVVVLKLNNKIPEKFRK